MNWRGNEMKGASNSFEVTNKEMGFDVTSTSNRKLHFFFSNKRCKHHLDKSFSHDKRDANLKRVGYTKRKNRYDSMKYMFFPNVYPVSLLSLYFFFLLNTNGTEYKTTGEISCQKEEWLDIVLTRKLNS